jgi:hypothetical protein
MCSAMAWKPDRKKADGKVGADAIGWEGDDVAALFAARCTQVLGALIVFALDQPQAQPLKVARREFVEGQGVGCARNRRLGLGQGFTSCKMCSTYDVVGL